MCLVPSGNLYRFKVEEGAGGMWKMCLPGGIALITQSCLLEVHIHTIFVRRCLVVSQNSNSNQQKQGLICWLRQLGRTFGWLRGLKQEQADLEPQGIELGIQFNPFALSCHFHFCLVCSNFQILGKMALS